MMNQTLEGGLRSVESAFGFIKDQVASYDRQQLKKKNYKKQLVKRFLAASTAALLVTVVNTPEMRAAAETAQAVQTNPPAYDTTLKLDDSNYSLLVLEQRNVQITPGKSIADQQAEQAARVAAAHAAEVAARAHYAQVGTTDTPSEPRSTSSLPTDVAHRMAQEAAAKAGIPDQWKLLAAVWQKETGKSGDSCIVSGADGRATGPMQFMPSTFRSHASNPNANICRASDALEAAANLLRDSGLDQGDARSALMSYNHSDAYVHSVQQIANSIQ